MSGSDHNAHASAAPGSAATVLPRADAPEPLFSGFRFNSGDASGDAGVFVFTRRLGGDLYPILVGEAEDMAKAIAHVRGHDDVVARESDGLFWMARANARQRSTSSVL